MKLDNKIEYVGNTFGDPVISNITWTTDTSTTAPNIDAFKSDYTWSVNNKIQTYIDQEVLKQLVPQLDAAREQLEKDNADRELEQRQKKNKRLRELIKQVIFSGPMTIVKWNDGTITRVRCAEDETYDQEKGLLAAMAKKLYEDTNIFVEELAYWCEQPEEEEEEPKGYAALKDKDDFYKYYYAIEDEELEKLQDWFDCDD